MSRSVVVLLIALAVVACSGADGPATTVSAPPGASTAGGSGPDVTQPGSSGSGDCPLEVADLNRITGTTWTLEERRVDHPYELDESVIISVVCRYLAPDITTELGANMSLRAEVLTPPHAEAFREDFFEYCDLMQREVVTGPGDTVVCPWNDGSVPEGIAGDSNRLLQLYFINWHTAQQMVSDSIEKLLRAGR